MLRLILVRHGETDWNVAGRYQGQTDIELNAAGREQARQVAARLADQSFDAAYASDLKRAWETAQIIAQQNGIDVQSEPRLRELRFGLIEGLTWAEAQEKYPGVIKHWLEDRDQPPSGGEAASVFTARVQALIDDLVARHDEQTVLLVGHGGPLAEVIRLALKMPPEGRWAFEIGNTSVSELHIYGEDYHRPARLSRLNDTTHLGNNHR